MALQNSLLAALLAALPILALAGCDKPMNPIQQKAADDRAVAQVEATERALPPLRPVMPQPLARSFIAGHAVGGKGCAFVPKGETAAIALLLDDSADLRIDNQPAVFSADKGSTKLPSGAWSRYIGKALALAVAQPGAGSPIARLSISDPHNRPVYQASGTLRCPAV